MCVVRAGSGVGAHAKRAASDAPGPSQPFGTGLEPMAAQAASFVG